MTTADVIHNLIASAVVLALFATAYLVSAREGHRFVERMSRQGEPGTRAETLLGESAVVIRALAKVRAGDRWSVQREALKRIKDRFERESISIPAMPLTVYRKDGAGTAT